MVPVSAEKVHGHRVRGFHVWQWLCISIGHHLGIQPLCTAWIGLEETPHADFKSQSVKVFHHMVFSRHMMGGAITGFHAFALVVIQCVNEAGQTVAQFLLQAMVEVSRIKLLQTI